MITPERALTMIEYVFYQKAELSRLTEEQHASIPSIGAGFWGYRPLVERRDNLNRVGDYLLITYIQDPVFRTLDIALANIEYRFEFERYGMEMVCCEMTNIVDFAIFTKRRKLSLLI